jgi:uncharacterized repeat protein (TIGR04138 family)
MNGPFLDDATVDRLRERNPRFHETAYLFILSALHHVIERLPETRHISGRELAQGRFRFRPGVRGGALSAVTLLLV